MHNEQTALCDLPILLVYLVKVKDITTLSFHEPPPSADVAITLLDVKSLGGETSIEEEDRDSHL